MSKREVSSEDLKRSIHERYQRIEQRLHSIPCLSQEEVCELLEVTEPHLSSMEDANQILGFRFDKQPPLFPLSQFNLKKRKVSSTVPALLVYLRCLDDWALLDWLTSDHPDFEGQPIDLLCDSDLRADLVEAARFHYGDLIESLGLGEAF
jgi:hypothetical protein